MKVIKNLLESKQIMFVGGRPKSGLTTFLMDNMDDSCMFVSKEIVKLKKETDDLCFYRLNFENYAKSVMEHMNDIVSTADKKYIDTIIVDGISNVSINDFEKLVSAARETGKNWVFGVTLDHFNNNLALQRLCDVSIIFNR